jgi:hypothetical protein
LCGTVATLRLVRGDRQEMVDEPVETRFVAYRPK